MIDNNKKENNKTGKQRLEELEQQQLINSILGRKEMEHEALVEATINSMKDSNVNIEQEKERIINKKQKDIANENRKEILKLRREIIKEEVDKELQKMNEEEAKRKAERAKETESILQELGIIHPEVKKQPKKYYKKPDDKDRIKRLIERKSNDELRKKQSIKDIKARNFLRQIDLMNKKEEKARISRLEEEYIKSRLEEKTRRLKIEETSKDTVKDSQKRNNIDDNTQTTDNKESKIIEPMPEENKTDTSKISYKLSYAIQQYEKTMQNIRDYFLLLKNSKSKVKKLPAQTTTKTQTPIKTKKEERKSFVEVLSSVINHKKANEDYINKSKEGQQTRFDPRTH